MVDHRCYTDRPYSPRFLCWPLAWLFSLIFAATHLSSRTPIYYLKLFRLNRWKRGMVMFLATHDLHHPQQDMQHSTMPNSFPYRYPYQQYQANVVAAKAVAACMSTSAASFHSNFYGYSPMYPSTIGGYYASNSPAASSEAHSCDSTGSSSEFSPVSVASPSSAHALAPSTTWCLMPPVKQEVDDKQNIQFRNSPHQFPPHPYAAQQIQPPSANPAWMSLVPPTSQNHPGYMWMNRIGKPAPFSRLTAAVAQQTDSKTRTAGKYRMVYTSKQRVELEKEFHTTKYINSHRKQEISQELGLSERQIKIWFQNRRAKERKQGGGNRLADCASIMPADSSTPVFKPLADPGYSYYPPHRSILADSTTPVLIPDHGTGC